MEMILNTKLHVPPLRPGLMPRARLIERLDEGCHAGCRLILVSAPPGYGKTTLLSEWARGRQVAWLTLDEGDMGLVLPNADVSTLVARTKGWAAGLQMAALSLQAQPDQAALVQAFGGSHRYIFDYLLEEVLSHQPVGVQEFLLKTSILERLTAPLCDAVIQEEEKEGLPARPFSDSQTALEYLERANLFLVPLDDGR